MGGKRIIFCLVHLVCCRADNCSFVPDVDYTTTNGGETKSKSREECCAACQAIPDCIAGVFQAHSSKCFLKGGHVKALPPDKNKGIVACVARKPSPLPPPFNCSTPGKNCAGRLGATHWNPCYFINGSIPSLLDGAQSLAKTGARVIKVAAFSPAGNYPFNSPNWSKTFPTLLSVVSHDYYRQLWQMSEFETYVLIAYSSVGGDGGGDISYWKKGITSAQAAEETKQLHAAATFLLDTYGHLGKTFVFENWEGDWASRDNYDPKKPATPLALASMRTWLQARQAGITLARNGYLSTAKGKASPRGKVFFSAEVNLVYSSMTTGAANMVNRVLPFVATDMVSYSSYDTQVRARLVSFPPRECCCWCCLYVFSGCVCPWLGVHVCLCVCLFCVVDV